MATEESKLIVAVDSTSVPKAGAELDAYTASAAKADAATGKLAATSRASSSAHVTAASDISLAEQAASKYAETEAQAAARIHDMIAASLAAADASKAQAAAQAAASAKATESTAAQVAASKALADAQTRQMAAWTASRAPVVELEGILAKTTLTTAEVAKAEMLLDRAQAAGVISAGELAAAFKALDAAKIKDIATTEAQVAANKSALSSRATGELATGLSEVLSGNVGRLRRTGAAFANQSGLLSKLFTPVGAGVTAAIAALALFGKAMYDREKDVEAFNQALAQSGRYAQGMGDTLVGVAGQVGALTGRYGDATKAVLALTAQGHGLDANLGSLATTVTNLANITGESIDKVAQNLTDLQKDPVSAITKTTSLMGLLTEAQFKEIAALQDTQGPAAAAALAIKDIGDQSEKTAKQLEDNAGYIKGFIDSVSSFASRAVFLIENVGSKSVSTQIAVLEAQKKNLQNALNGPGASYIPGYSAIINKSIDQANAQLAVLKNQQQSQAMFTAGQDLALQSRNKLEAAYGELSKKELNTAQNLQDTYKQINDERRQALALATTQGQRDTINANADKKIQDATKKYNQSFGGSGSLGGSRSHVDQGANALNGFSQYVGGLTTKAIGVEGDAALTAYVQGVAKLDAEFDKYLAKGADVNVLTEKYNEGMKALGDTLAETKKKQQALTDQAVEAYAASLDKATEALQRQIDAQVASVGMGAKEYQRQQQINQVYAEQADELQRLALVRQQASQKDAELANEAYKRDVAKLQQATDSKVAALQDGYKRMDAAQGDWLNGAHAAMQDYIDAQNNMANLAKQTVNDFANGLSGALVQVATGAKSAKDAFGDFIDTLYAEAVKFVADQAIKKFFEYLQGTHSETYGTDALTNGFNIGGSSGGGSGGGFWSEVGGIIGAIFGSGRATGGPVDSGHIYPVVENGPELLSVGGKSYLMMGKESGYVTPTTSTTQNYGRNRTTINVTVQPTSSRRTAQQVAQEVARKQRIATARNG